MNLQFADRLQHVQEYYFARKLEYVQQMRNRGIDVINLGLGSPDLPPPPAAIATAVTAIQQPTSHGYSSYRSTPELRTAMSQWYQRCFGIVLDPVHDILPLLGSKEGILYLSMALLNPGDAVLVPNPGYPSYTSVTQLLGAEIIYYDLTEENDWLPDMAQLEQLDLSKCKLMWVNYPHMPTGKVGSLDLFQQLVDLARRKNLVICNDNPYGLVLNETPPLSILKADPQREVTCELNSMSKSFNMAGWRVGMILGCKELINAVLQVKSNVDSGCFLPIQKGAVEALQVEDSWHVERNQTYARRRELIWQIFEQLNFTFQKDRVGLFVWAKAPDSIVDVPAYLDEILDQAHVFLTPGVIFGSNGSRYGRAALCAPEATIQKALERIRDFCA